MGLAEVCCWRPPGRSEPRARGRGGTVAAAVAAPAAAPPRPRARGSDLPGGLQAPAADLGKPRGGPRQSSAGGAAVPAPAGKLPSARGSAGPGKRFFSFSTKFGSIGYNRNQTERTEPEISQFLVLKRTEPIGSVRIGSVRTERPARAEKHGTTPSLQRNAKFIGHERISFLFPLGDKNERVWQWSKNGATSYSCRYQHKCRSTAVTFY